MAPDISAAAEAALTGDPRVAYLSTCHDDKPHVAPLWFTYRDGAIEIATTGRKLINIRNNPRVALSVQEDEAGHPKWGLTAYGTATVVDDEAEAREILVRINRRYGAEDDAWSENTPVRIEIGSLEYWEY